MLVNQWASICTSLGCAKLSEQAGNPSLIIDGHKRMFSLLIRSTPPRGKLVSNNYVLHHVKDVLVEVN